jgi:eukaryotic-like serine/threonine-protein kinase
MTTDSHLLASGQQVLTESSRLLCDIHEFLGGGGQGEVYMATISGAPVAVKWYFTPSATRQQRAALELLVRKSAPNERFLWPVELVSAASVTGFGYVMPLREPRYKGIVDLMKRRIEPTFTALAKAGRDLAHSYLLLHSQGFCYRDISFGNVFFDPAIGDVLICDNDNVAIDGDTYNGVLGTPRFMAPELVRGQAHPSTETDLFSLAVLLFYMLMVHHAGREEGSRD